MATPSHVDLSVLWVPIMPETSKLGEQMEKVGQDATESFGKGSEKLGDKITDSVAKSSGRIKDTFQKTGSDASDAMADGVKQNSKKVEDAIGDTGEKAKTRFGEVAKGLGKKLTDAIGPDTQRMLGDKLEEVVGGSLEGVLGDKAKWGGKLARSIGDWGLDELKQKFSGVRDEAQRTQEAVGNISDGNKGKVAALTDGFVKVKDAVKQSGVEIGNLPQPVQDVVDKTNDAKQSVQGIADIFSGLPGKVGAFGAKIGELGTVIATVITDLELLKKTWDEGPSRYNGSDGHTDWWNLIAGKAGTWAEGKYNQYFHGDKSDKPSGASDYNDMLLGDHPGGDQASANFKPGPDQARWGDTLGSSGDAYDVFSSGQPLALGDGSGGFSWGGDKTPPKPERPERAGRPERAPRETSSTPRSSYASGSSIGSVSSRGDLRRAGGRVAALYELAYAMEGTPYSQALRNDCSGMVSRLATAALGMEPSVQFSTVNEGDWLFSHGFQPGQGPPGSLRIGWYDHGGGNAGHTAATLPDGTHAESGGAHGNFLLGPGAAGAEDPQFEHHAWLPMDGSAKRPVGTQHDPLYVMRADTSGGSDTSDPTSSTQSLSEQFGQGFLGGIAQSVGLDGSVFKGFGGASNPMNFGITKFATGLLNHLLTPGKQGAAISNGVIPLGPGGAQSVRPDGGDTYNFHGPVSTGMNVTQNGATSPTADLNDMNNSGRTGTVTLPNAGNLPAS